MENYIWMQQEKRSAMFCHINIPLFRKSSRMTVQWIHKAECTHSLNLSVQCVREWSVHLNTAREMTLQLWTEHGALLRIEWYVFMSIVYILQSPVSKFTFLLRNPNSGCCLRSMSCSCVTLWKLRTEYGQLCILYNTEATYISVVFTQWKVCSCTLMTTWCVLKSTHKLRHIYNQCI